MSKMIFKKIKKIYYFNTFLDEKHFEKGGSLVEAGRKDDKYVVKVLRKRIWKGL
jgi:hypothetical protein